MGIRNASCYWILTRETFSTEEREHALTQLTFVRTDRHAF